MKKGIVLRNLNQKGFTLVEVIVVAIIVAALAAVSIPLYNNYVATSKRNAAANAAGSVASFMGACMNQSGSVSGATASSPVAGPATLACAYGKSAADTTKISVPDGITVTVSSITASPGTVKAFPTGSAKDSTTYNY